MEENKKENEEAKTKVVENKNEEKKYNEKNLTFSIILAAIIVAVCTLHWILEGIKVSGNLPWLIINSICVAGALCVAIVGGLFFFKVTMNNLKKDIPSFCVSLAAFALATIYSVSWSVDLIRNIVGCIQGNL